MPVRRGFTPLKELGSHVLLDAWECPAALLDDLELIRDVLISSIELSGATLIDLCTHKFSPQGVTATATLAESHLAIHTWPEHGYFAADIFFCGSLDPQKAIDEIVARLGAGEVRTRDLRRGFDEVPRS